MIAPSVRLLLAGWLGELLGALLAGAAFLLVFLAAEAWHRRGHPPVEWTRKLIHVGTGVVGAGFPWLFGSHWTLLALGAVTMLAIQVTRARGGLKSLFGVERPSRGELYLPIAIYLLFVLARHQPVFYLISVFTLAFSDPMAALLGSVYGRLRYPSGPEGRERKTVEGSIAFLLVTFLIVHLMLLLGTGLTRPATVLIAAQIALLVTSFEAIAQHGNDNLVLPLATYYLLVKMSAQPAEGIAFQLAVQLAILMLSLLVAWRSRLLTLAGAVAAHLVLYGCFSLGGPAWLAAPALALASVAALETRLRRRSPERHAEGRQVQAVFYVSIVSMLLMFADNTFATLAPRPGLEHRAPIFLRAVRGRDGGSDRDHVLPVPAHRATPLAARSRGARRSGRGLRGRRAARAAGRRSRRSVPRVRTGGRDVCDGGGALPLRAAAAQAPPASRWDFRLQAFAVGLTVLVTVPYHLAQNGALWLLLR